MNSLPRKYQLEYVFLGACLAVLAATVYNLVLQHLAVPATMRYVPPESSVYAFTSSLRSIWDAADPHVGGFFRAVSPANGKRKATGTGPVTALAQAIKKTLRDEGLHISRIDDLAALGIDPDAAAAVAVVRADGTGFIAVIPVVSEEKFLETAGKLFGGKVDASKSRLQLGNRDYMVYKRGAFYITFPGDSTALVTDDEGLIPRALNHSEANLAFFRSSDHTIRNFTQLLLGYEVRPKAWVKGSATLGPTARGLQFVVSFTSDRVLVRGRIAPPVGQSRHLQKAVARGQLELASLRQEMGSTSMAAVLVDPAASYYFGLLERQIGNDLKSQFQQLFPGVWEQLEKRDTATRVSLAVSGEAKSVPDVLLGVQMPQVDAQDLVFKLQSKLRLDRDTQILDSAFEQRRKNFDDGTKRDESPVTLVSEKLLSDERDPLWSRYRKVKGAITAVPPLTPSDFANSTYVKEHDGYMLRFILPPMTDDDFRYRLSDEAKGQVSERDLRADRHRLCSVYWEGTLWFGNDAERLLWWLNRQKASGANVDLDDAIRIAGNSLRSKVTLFLHPRQLLEQGLLHPDPRVNEATNKYLSDIDHYRAVLLTIAPDENEREFHVGITLLRY